MSSFYTSHLVITCEYLQNVKMRYKTKQVITRFMFLSPALCLVRPKKNICVFPVTRPTLIFPSDPKVFIGIPKNEILSNATYPICDYF